MAQDTKEPLLFGRPRARVLRYAGIGLVVVIILGGGVVFARRQLVRENPAPTTTTESLPSITTPKPEEQKLASELSGELVTASLAKRRPLAIMVENHVDARPQFGLSQASVIYEAISEGGITRYMALFGSGDVAKVGPVRSARTYFMDWAMEYDAGYAHVGGSKRALTAIPSLPLHNLDQFAIGIKAFRRELKAGVDLEHTMFTDTTKLRTVMDEDFGNDQTWTRPTFQTPITRDHRPASHSLTVNFSSPSFKVIWTYDPETNTYLRSLAGSPDKDSGSGETLRAANIFVQDVQRGAHPTEKDEVPMTTIGSGKAQVFQDGKRIEATWKKVTHSSPTEFTDLSGNKISRNPGVTWFEVLDPASSVTFTAPTS